MFSESYLGHRWEEVSAGVKSTRIYRPWCILLTPFIPTDMKGKASKGLQDDKLIKLIPNVK